MLKARPRNLWVADECRRQDGRSFWSETGGNVGNTGKAISCRDNPVVRDRISGSVKCSRVRVAVKRVE